MTHTAPTLTEAPPKRSRKRWVLIGAAGVAVFLLGIGAGTAGSKAPQASTPTPVAAPVTVTATAAATRPAPVTVTATATPPSVTVTEGPPPASLREGTNIVGTDVQPGTYRSTGDTCYWARLSGFSGKFEDLIANGNGPAVVTIEDGDKGFQSDRCAPWTKVN